jgi:hypothetical protein
MPEYDNTNRGSLFKNDKRENDSQATHTGSINVDGVEYWLNAWVKTSKAGRKFFSLSVKPKQGAAKPRQEARQPAAPDYDDEPPF